MARKREPANSDSSHATSEVPITPSAAVLTFVVSEGLIEVTDTAVSLRFQNRKGSHKRGAAEVRVPYGVLEGAEVTKVGSSWPALRLQPSGVPAGTERPAVSRDLLAIADVTYRRPKHLHQALLAIETARSRATAPVAPITVVAAGGVRAELRWVAPPGWPCPEGDWLPPVGWLPDPSWPAAPRGWKFWSADAVLVPRATPEPAGLEVAARGEESKSSPRTREQAMARAAMEVAGLERQHRRAEAEAVRALERSRTLLCKDGTALEHARGAVVFDDEGLFVSRAAFGRKDQQLLVRWADVDDILIEGQEASTSRVSGRERKAFGVIASEHTSQRVEAQAITVLTLTTAHRPLVVRLPGVAPSSVTAALATILAEVRERAGGNIAQAAGGGNPLDAIERLGQLRDRGLITEEEFAAKRIELLGRL